MTLKDGLYRVTYGTLCAGFVVCGGRVTRCAPVLQKRISYWVNKAERVAMGGDELQPFGVFCRSVSSKGFDDVEVELDPGEDLVVRVGRMCMTIKPTEDWRGIRIHESGNRRLLIIPEVSNVVQVRSREDEGEF